MRGAVIGTMMLAGCGGADGSVNRSAPAAVPTVKASLSVANPLIGVWARISGAHCRFDQIEFTADRMTSETSSDAPMRTVAVRFDLSNPSLLSATPANEAAIRFRIIDPAHIGDDAGCVYAQAD